MKINFKSLIVKAAKAALAKWGPEVIDAGEAVAGDAIKAGAAKARKKLPKG